MKIEDFRKLKKLMNMTLSGADQEKLTAINAANDIVRNSETTWDRILDRVIKVEVEIESVDTLKKSPQEAQASFKKKVNNAFADIEESDPRSEAADFIASLKEQWDAHNRLSERQLEALWKFAHNARQRIQAN